VARITTSDHFSTMSCSTYPLITQASSPRWRSVVRAEESHACVELTSEALAARMGSRVALVSSLFSRISRVTISMRTKILSITGKQRRSFFLNLPNGGAAVLNACDPATALSRDRPEGCASFAMVWQRAGLRSRRLDFGHVR